MTQRIRVLLVEAHAVVRQGLIALLSSLPDLEIVGSAVDGAEAVEMFASCNPDVTLMDLKLPKLGGVEAITRIRQITLPPVSSYSPHSMAMKTSIPPCRPEPKPTS